MKICIIKNGVKVVREMTDTEYQEILKDLNNAT